MNIYEKLLSVQTKLKAPKSQYNDFGKYNYRNCEDILEAAKPLCKEVNAVVWLSDEIVMIGERYYVKAMASFVDAENCEKLTAVAFAREEESKKGMDVSQLTGASSSYARKYALNGLFDIDDTKDSDTTNTHGAKVGENEAPTPVVDYRVMLAVELKRRGIDVNEFSKEHNLNKETSPEELKSIYDNLLMRKKGE